MSSARLVEGFIILVMLVVFGTIFYTLYEQLVVENPLHHSFCESIGLEFEGFPSGKYYSSDAIACTGFKSNGYVVFRVFLFKDGKHFEVEQ